MLHPPLCPFVGLPNIHTLDFATTTFESLQIHVQTYLGFTLGRVPTSGGAMVRADV